MIASAGSNNAAQTFSALDRSHKGYVTQGDVASYGYLSSNFHQCDSNGDGRLSSDEVAQCMRNMPSSQQ